MNDPRDDRLDHDDLSDAERAAIEEGTDTGAEPAQAPPAPAATPAPAPAEEDTATSELREAAHALTAAAQAMQQAQAAQQQPAAAQEPAPAPRDFEAELAALEAKYDDGEIEMKEFLRSRDAVREAQMEAKLDARRAAEHAQQLEQSWAQAYMGFFQGPEAEVNARLASGVLKTGFDAIAVELVAQGKSFNEALTEARRQVFEQVGIPLPGSKSADDAIAKATQQRQPANRPGPGLGDMPAAASLATGAAQELDNLKIEDLEMRIARMNPTELDAYLASAEGGLRDNPRGG